MNCHSVPAQLYTVTADNGDPLLLVGLDESGTLFLWPTRYISQHKVGFARWCRRNVSRYKGSRAILHHPLCAETRRWAEWLGVRFQEGVGVL